MISRNLEAARCAFSAGIVLFAIACGGGTATPEPQAPVVAAPVEEPVKEEMASLDILCEPPTPVLVDGKPAGTTPITGYKVSPGTHDVTFQDEVTGPRTMTVKLEPGDGRVVKSDRAIIEKRN